MVSSFAKQTCFVGKLVTTRLHFDEGADLSSTVDLNNLQSKPVVHRYRTNQIDAKTSDRGSLIKELAAKLAPQNAFAPALV